MSMWNECTRVCLVGVCTCVCRVWGGMYMNKEVLYVHVYFAWAIYFKLVGLYNIH